MDSQKTVLFGAVFAVAAGLFGLNTMVDGMVQNDSTLLSGEGGSIVGHVTYTLFDKDGNIKAYQQTDNAVTNIGMNCAAEFLFDNATLDTGDCSPTTGYTGFQYVAIGNGTLTVNTAMTALNAEMAQAGYARVQDTTPLHTAASGTSGSSVTVIEPAAFTFTGIPSGTTISETGLFDANSGGKMFAGQTINTPVTSTDSLAVKWTITIS